MENWLIKWMVTMPPIIFSPRAGPTNIVVGSGGMKNGIIRTIPLILGVNVTIFIMALVVDSGLGNIFKLYPLVYSILKYIGVLYILYLAYKFF